MPLAWRGVLALWIALLLVGEGGVFLIAIASCPASDPTATATATAACPSPRSVLIVADPQLTDHVSYGLRKSWGNTWGYAAAQAFISAQCDIYIAAALAAVRAVGPPLSAAFDLGDVLDGGRDYADGPEWDAGVARASRIHSALGPRTPWRFVAGNHDVHIGPSMDSRRFQAAFGPSNDVVPVDGVDFVLLNSLALQIGAAPRERKDALALLASLAASEDPEDPPAPSSAAVLLVHQPLFRPQSASCGRLRNGRPVAQIPFQERSTYATQARSHVTDHVLNAVPRLHAVFSGDDHDPCVVTHHRRDGTVVVETTLPTLSWLQGTPWPGLALLTPQLDATCTPVAVHTRICFLPNRYWVLAVYAAAAVAAMAVRCVLLAPHLPSDRVSHSKKFDEEDNAPTHAPSSQPHPCSHARDLARKLIHKLIRFNWLCWLAGLAHLLGLFALTQLAILKALT